VVVVICFTSAPPPPHPITAPQENSTNTTVNTLISFIFFDPFFKFGLMAQRKRLSQLAAGACRRG
jgi:hypothetical protein